MKKTIEQRLKEVIDLRQRLVLLGYSNVHEEVQRLYDVLNTYIKNGEYVKDQFLIHGYAKRIRIELLPREHAENVFLIQHDTNI